jgi:hypothetical protein
MTVPTEQGPRPLVRGEPACAAGVVAGMKHVATVSAKIDEDVAMIALPPPITALLEEMAADCELVHSVGNWHASQFMSALGLVAEQPRPLRDRLTDICEIAQAREKVQVVIRRTA